eukprot:TRINITY_DN2495_c0_g1_i7.p1 TRINITY_DN2495_c0_g1~~TRINITY_DN2495_c0_g1_i7.p1  ORF type:complete len:137 (+),score=24.81 TRINITY_DN2495_c0_g1_i7:270-680(+)
MTSRPPPPIPPRPNFASTPTPSNDVESTNNGTTETNTMDIEEINLDAVGDALREVNLASIDDVISDTVDWDTVADQVADDIIMPQNRTVSITADTTGYQPQSYNPLSEKTFTSLSDLVHSSGFKEMKPNWSVAQAE